VRLHLDCTLALWLAARGVGRLQPLMRRGARHSIGPRRRDRLNASLGIRKAARRPEAGQNDQLVRLCQKA
jgi:hypothetical protein